MAKSSVNQLADANFDALFGARQGERITTGGFKMLAPGLITTRPQVRKTFSQAEMDELRASIREMKAQGLGIEGSGIFQALLVVFEENGYRLVMGEKRLRCALAEELAEMPCIVVAGMSEGTTRLVQLTENAVRTPPPTLEEAAAICETITEQNLSLREMAQMLGKDKSYIEDRVNLHKKYEDDIKNMVSARADSLRHARHVHKITDERLRSEIIRAVIEDEISEREVQRRMDGDNESGSDTDNQNGNSNPISTRSRTLGEGGSSQSDTPQDPLNQCLKPASSFAAEAARLLKTAHLTPDYRNEIEAELSILKKQIGKIEQIIG